MKVDILFDMFFQDLPLSARIQKISIAGWQAIETWKGGDADELLEIRRACTDFGVELVSIVMNGPSDASVAPVNAGNRAAFLERMDRYSDNALAAGCSRGITCSGGRVAGKDFYQQKKSLIEALSQAGEMAERKSFHLNLEPLNDKVDHAGYYLNSRDEAADIVRQVDSPNVRFLYDFYHEQIMGGDHIAFLEANIEYVGHFHAAGVPGRHEIFHGEINYPYLIQRIRQMGYTGCFGLEYMPLLESDASLRQTRDYLASAID